MDKQDLFWIYNYARWKFCTKDVVQGIYYRQGDEIINVESGSRFI